ncbi:MAG: HAD hydrolase-like protein, partial [Clostridiales bacterium]|nr:HAD hydrolase-like protein [Clostridiales bacterium]
MKYKYESVFFDLDGTLFDTSKGIYETFDRVFATRGKTVDKGLYPSFIGPPVSSTLARFFEPGEVAAAHDDFRAYYNSEAKFKARLYDG